jgi:hypothetical protein
MLGSVVGKSGSAGAAHSTFAPLRWTQGVCPRGVVLEEAAGRNGGVLLRRLGRYIEPMDEPQAEILEEGRAAPATAPECARSTGRASRPTLVPPHQLSLPVPTCLHRVPSPSLALASPSLGRVIPAVPTEFPFSPRPAPTRFRRPRVFVGVDGDQPQAASSKAGGHGQLPVFGRRDRARV